MSTDKIKHPSADKFTRGPQPPRPVHRLYPWVILDEGAGKVSCSRCSSETESVPLDGGQAFMLEHRECK